MNSGAPSPWHPAYIPGIPEGPKPQRPWMVVSDNPRRHLVERKRGNMRRFDLYSSALRAARAQNRKEQQT